MTVDPAQVRIQVCPKFGGHFWYLHAPGARWRCQFCLSLGNVATAGESADWIGRALWSTDAPTRHTVKSFLQLAQDVRNRFPSGRLTRTPGGYLAIYEGGVYRGYVDIRGGSVELAPLPEFRG